MTYRIRYFEFILFLNAYSLRSIGKGWTCETVWKRVGRRIQSTTKVK